jgi:hypothetical protein
MDTTHLAVFDYTINGLPMQTGDILCTQDGALDVRYPQAIRPGEFWHWVGRLVPGDVDHIAIYVGPAGRCIEAGALGVISFMVAGGQWDAARMMAERGLFVDTFYGVAYPLQGRGLAPEEEARLRAEVGAYCTAQLGKPYNLNLLNPEAEDAFYCSQLVYKAYQRHGIHLNCDPCIQVVPGTEGIVYPQEIWEACFHRKSDYLRLSMVHVPETILPLLHDYAQSFDAGLPGLLAGVYLVGSVALGAFDEQRSDIDVVAVLSRPPAADLAGLRALHQALRQRHPRQKLECSYLQWSDLGKPESEVPPFPAFHDGKLNPASHFELHPVTWWMLKQHALTLRGPAAASLPFEASWEALEAWTRNNLVTYWGDWTRQPLLKAALLTDAAVEWTVLGVLRLHYTLREQQITSKQGAGEYALAHLPEEWHPIILEALNLRVGRAERLFRGRLGRARQALRLLEYVIEAGVAKSPGSK